MPKLFVSMFTFICDNTRKIFYQIINIERFKSYLSTEELMDEIPFWDLFSRKIEWQYNNGKNTLESNGLNILILE